MSDSAFVILKRSRVHQDGRGELQPGRVPAKPWSDDPAEQEAWWRDVLTWDRRLKLPETPSIPKDSPDAWYRLDRYPRWAFEVRCPCGLACTDHSVERLRAQLGGEGHQQLPGLPGAVTRNPGAGFESNSTPFKQRSQAGAESAPPPARYRRR